MTLFAVCILVVVLVLMPLLAIVQRQMRRGALSYTLGFVWSAAIIVAMMFAIFPSSLEAASRFAGFEIAANLFFLLASLFLAVICFVLSLRSAAQRQQITTLSQEVGLLQQRVENAERNRA